MTTVPGYYKLCGALNNSGIFVTGAQLARDCSLVGKHLGPTAGSTTPPIPSPAIWEYAEDVTHYMGTSLYIGHYGALWVPNGT